MDQFLPYFWFNLWWGIFI